MQVASHIHDQYHPLHRSPLSHSTKIWTKSNIVMKWIFSGITERKMKKNISVLISMIIRSLTCPITESPFQRLIFTWCKQFSHQKYTNINDWLEIIKTPPVQCICTDIRQNWCIEIKIDQGEKNDRQDKFHNHCGNLFGDRITFTISLICPNWYFNFQVSLFYNWCWKR